MKNRLNGALLFFLFACHHREQELAPEYAFFLLSYAPLDNKNVFYLRSEAKSKTDKSIRSTVIACIWYDGTGKGLNGPEGNTGIAPQVEDHTYTTT